MVSTGMALVKYLLFTFNLIFAMSGLALLVIGGIIQTNYQHYNQFMDVTLFTAPILLMLIGVVVFVVASFGCTGAIMENYCIVMAFSVSLVLIFFLEIGAGIAGYVLKDDVLKKVELNLKTAMDLYPEDINDKNAWNILQSDLHCCGVKSSNDWEEVFHNDTLPWSCCHKESNATINLSWDPQCTKGTVLLSDEKETGVYTTGCLEALMDLLTKNSIILGGMGIGIAFIQVVGVVFSCCLAKSIRKEYESV